MDIVVCVKQVPEVTDAELEVAKDGAQIVTEDLEFDINEWDNYAVEEAVRLKEAFGGRVTVITVGNEDSEDVLRQALAMGADEAIRVDEQGFDLSDARGIARGIFQVVKDLRFDLLFTGAQSSDYGWGQIGDNKLVALRELESNTQEKVELPVPAVLTIQTGLNSPRYVSIMGIQKARKIGIKDIGADELGLTEEEIGPKGSAVGSRLLSIPPAGEGAEILTGTIDEISEKAAQIIREKGGVL